MPNEVCVSMVMLYQPINDSVYYLNWHIIVHMIRIVLKMIAVSASHIAIVGKLYNEAVILVHLFINSF